MSETNLSRDDDEFEPSARVEAASNALENEGTNVCRAAAIAMFSQAEGRDFPELVEPLRLLGFSEALDIYAEQLQYGRAATSGFETLPPLADGLAEDARIAAWGAFSQAGDAGSAWVYLAAMLESFSERESAASAAAILRLLRPVTGATNSWVYGPWPWMSTWLQQIVREVLEPYDLPVFLADEFDFDSEERGDRPAWLGRAWRDLQRRILDLFSFLDARSLLLVIARVRLQLATTSEDEVTRELAFAAISPPATLADGPSEPVEPASSYPGALTVSTMVHGTRAWKGRWWRPGGDFHSFVLRNHRPNLYDRGARFSWSGALSAQQRITAASDFLDWIGEIAPHGLQTVFAHSYGGEVASRAALKGAKIHEAVLLSVPAEPSACALVNSPRTRVVDIRTPFDPVLALAGRGQRLDGVESVLLPWRLGHAASHRASIWERYDVATAAGI